MITVIIAGGSGTRLWPLSTHHKPKQILTLVNNQSPLQEAYARASTVADSIYIVPESRLVEDIKTQFPELSDEQLITEPGLRGTASCYILALDYISRRHPSDEPIAFIWADHHVRDVAGFTDSFQLAADMTSRMKRLVTVGVEPTYPAALGYIERGEELDDSGVYNVVSFKEKPEPKIALEYIESGRYLWNTGYYIGSVDTFLRTMQHHAPDLFTEYESLHAIEDVHSDEYKQAYLAFENTTIDVALAEKTPDLLVVPARFDWLDIGNFKDLHEANPKDEIGNHVYGEGVHVNEVENTYIRNEEQKPVAVIGLDNVVVVNTPDGILVARKDLAHKVGDIAKKIQAGGGK